MQEEHPVTTPLHKVKRITLERIKDAATESLAIHNHVITAVSVTSHCARLLHGNLGSTFNPRALNRRYSTLIPDAPNKVTGKTLHPRKMCRMTEFI
jgi:hypothetical protein